MRRDSAAEPIELRKKLQSYFSRMLRLRLGCWYSGTSREASVRSAGQKRSKSADPIRLSLRARMLTGVGFRDEAKARSMKAATWLILPVVICLSQRLSHACLSINCFIL